jgi:hypothetical protein
MKQHLSANRTLSPRALLLAAGILCTSSLPAQFSYPSSHDALFAPDDHVPLSEFSLKSSSTVTLHVLPEILTWVANQSSAVEIAIQPAVGPISYVSPTNVNTGTGAVTYTGVGTGPCVVVCDLLLQDVANGIVTHWNASANSGRGGQDIGARNGQSTLDYDPGTGELSASGPGIISPAVNQYWGDPVGTPPSGGDPDGVASTNPYYFWSNDYALFSDGSGQHHNAAVPAYERYIGENYALTAATEPAAIWLSDRVRELTGFPVAHRNHPEAFDAMAGAGQQVEDDLPLFQLVHCFEVIPPDEQGSDNYQDSDYVGNEHSLATFVLPPGWTSQAAAGSYPVLFKGFYDVNSTTFSAEGVSMMTAQAELYDDGGRAVVGLLWNGGGAAAGATFNRSAYANAAKLFAEAADLLQADPERIVLSGGSRGGTTALAIGSNPYGYDYTAKFIHARAPQVRVGTTIDTFINSSHSGLTEAVRLHTGYSLAWQRCWQDPDTGDDGRTLVARTLFGTDDFEAIDDELSINSEGFRDALQSEGGQVVLRIGTSDMFGPSALIADYVNDLRAMSPPVPVVFEVFYRFGHAVPADLAPDDADLLRLAFDEEDLTPATNYYARNPENYTAYVPISAPAHIPLAFEIPLLAGQTPTCSEEPPNPAPNMTWSFFGEPGGRVAVYTSASPIGIGNPGTEVFNDVLDGPSGGLGYLWDERSAMSQGLHYYQVKYSPDGDSTFEVTLGDGDVAPPLLLLPNNIAYLYVAAFESIGIDDQSRTGGVAEDGRFVQ